MENQNLQKATFNTIGASLLATGHPSVLRVDGDFEDVLISLYWVVYRDSGSWSDYAALAERQIG